MTACAHRLHHFYKRASHPLRSLRPEYSRVLSVMKAPPYCVSTEIGKTTNLRKTPRSTYPIFNQTLSPKPPLSSPLWTIYSIMRQELPGHDVRTPAAISCYLKPCSPNAPTSALWAFRKSPVCCSSALVSENIQDLLCTTSYDQILQHIYACPFLPPRLLPP